MNRSRLLTIGFSLLVACLAPQSAHAAYGDLDATFGSGGKVRLSSDMADTPVAVRVQTDGKIVFAMNPLSKAGGWLFRMKKTGAIDTGFAKGGRFEMPDAQKIEDLELLGDGRIAVLASSDPSSGMRRTRLTVLKPNGWPDGSFAGAGDLTLGINDSGMNARSLAIHGGSKFLLGGSLEGSTTTTSVMRLMSDGQLDTTFGNAGTASVPGTAMGSISDSWVLSTTALAVNDSGEILVGIDKHGDAPQGSALRSGVAKFTADGAVATTFGTNGIAPVLVYGDSVAGITSIAVASNGNIIAIGRGSYPGRGAGTIHSLNYLFPDGNTVPAAGGDASNAVGLGDAGFALSAPRRFSSLKANFAPNILFHTNSANLVLPVCETWGPIGAYADGRLVSISADINECEDLEPGLTVIRMLGPKGGKTAPQVRISTQVRSEYVSGGANAIWLHRLKGFAAPYQEMKRIEVAVQRVSSRLLANGRCEWFVDHATRSITTRARRGTCSSPKFMRAKGKGNWDMKFRRPLPVGRYRIYVRATTTSGVSNPLTKDPDSYKSFAVVKAK